MANEVDYKPCEYWGNDVTHEFGFNWKVLEKEDLIVSLIDGEVETVLTIGSGYQAEIETVGGVVTLETAPTATQKIKIERLVSNYQTKRYSTSTGFQGDEVEKSFDRTSCNLQDMQYNIDTFKSEFTQEVTTAITENKQELENEINEYKTSTDTEIANFETDVDNKIQQVNDAVNQLNKLDETLAECESCAATAEEQATIAQQAAEALVLNGVKKEVYLSPELLVLEDGYCYWTINHTLNNNNFSANLYNVSDNSLLWGEPYKITNSQVIYRFKKNIGQGAIKAVLIG